MNGSTIYEGRLEIKHHGLWGTICDDDFNEDAAKVICKRLGFKGKSIVKKDAYFGAGTTLKTFFISVSILFTKCI